MALPIFAITLFVSAFVLFLVQPIVGKMILPKLGGTPQVWNTCMVFFQAVLLAGYGYTHFSSTRLTVKRQIMLHALLLLVPILFLVPPIGPLNVEDFAPPPGGNPIFATLGLLAFIVGIPFFVVATSAPLLQRWFAYTGDKAAKDPYFLYAASNAGSLLALLFYPLVLEWVLPLKAQAVTWAIMYGALIGLVLVCAYRVWLTAPEMKLPSVVDTPTVPEGPAINPPVTPPNTDITATPPAPAPAPSTQKTTAVKKGPKHAQPKGGQPKKDIAVPMPAMSRDADELTGMRRLRWIMLGAVPSSLMLGVTTHITTDLSPIPLFWLIPLTLYLLSFILVFARWPVVWTEKPHEYFLYIQPVALALMMYSNMAAGGAHGIFDLPIILTVIGFFCTTMMCHGELARDRPGTRHLTEFYLLMSVGGVVGGVFNGLLAPMLFKGNLEYPLALIAACLVRPKMRESGWADDMVSNYLDEKAAAQGKAKAKVPSADNANFHVTMDGVLAGAVLVLTLITAFPLWEPISKMVGNVEIAYMIVFGIPTIIACFYFARPLRFGGAIAAILLIHALFYQNRFERGTLYADRSYFGFIRVRSGEVIMPTAKTKDEKLKGELWRGHEYTNLMHGNIDHGMNINKPSDTFLKTIPAELRYLEDYSRLATTYYHPLGPAGRVMYKFNWFFASNMDTPPDKDKRPKYPDGYPAELYVNQFPSDARMPVSLVGLGAAGLGAQLVGAWSEPAFATIGLGTGTMAAYGRPLQHVHFYEIDNHIRKLSLPVGGGTPYFKYIRDAKTRGSQVQVLMGDARQRMGYPYHPYNEDKEASGRPELKDGKPGGGPRNFYHMMVVDAFSSDAIPVHLLTQESFRMYFDKLVPEGILAVHTSNRYVNLVKVVADVAGSIEMTDPRSGTATYPFGKDGPVWYEPSTWKKAPLVAVRAHDNAPGYGGDDDRSRRQGHYTSEWVLVCRSREVLAKLTAPMEYKAKVAEDNKARAGKGYRPSSNVYFQNKTASEGFRYMWTDDFSNLIRVLRQFDDEDDR